MKKILVIFGILCTICFLTSCGEEEHIHNYSNTWSSNAEKHWKECVCGEKKEEAFHIAGEEATETMPQTCVECNYILKDVLEHTHNYNEVSSKDDAKLGKDGEIIFKCSCGEEVKETVHYYQWFECVNCFQKDPVREEIEEAFYLKFKETYFEKYNDEPNKNLIEVEYYYGEYNGCHVFDVSYEFSHYDIEWLKDNYNSFEQESLQYVSVCHNGEFYNLAEAVEINLISQSDLEQIIEVDKLYFPHQYHKFTEAEKTYLAKILKEELDMELPSYIEHWYRGEYSGTMIIYLSQGIAEMYKETINNVIIFYSSNDWYRVLYNDKIYTLKEAYLNLILTEEEIDKISLSRREFEDWLLRDETKEIRDEEPIKLEEKIKSNLTLENIDTSLVITIDKNFQLLLTKDHFKGIEFNTLTKLGNHKTNQQYLMTFKSKEEAFEAISKLESFYYVLKVDNHQDLQR